MTRQIEHNEAGFTLIEVMVAIAILTVGLLGANAMQVTSINGNHTATLLSNKVNWGADRIEQVMATDYDQVINSKKVDINNASTSDNGLSGLDNNTVGTADGSAISPDGRYNIYWNVAVDYPNEGLKTIKTIVENTMGPTKQVKMTYIKTQNY